MPVIDDLKAARALIADCGWTQGQSARNAKLDAVDVFDLDAVCFCSTGAVSRAVDGDFTRYRRAINALFCAAKINPVLFNDALGRTKAEVLAMFDKAIDEEAARAQ